MPSLARIGAAALALSLVVATAPAFADPTVPAHVTVHHTVHHVHHVHHIHTVKATTTAPAAPGATAAQAPAPPAPKP